MKGKDNFSVYFNNNKSPKRPKIIEKYGDNMKAIFDRIPKEVIREMPAIEKSKNLKQKSYINQISKRKKPDINKITKTMEESEKKILSEINSFKEIFYDYNKEQDEQMDNFEKIQDENNKFSKDYNKIQKDKAKFNTGTYLDYKPFINISSRYLSRNIKIPNLSKEHNIFKGNPLILEGDDLQDYITYNLGPKDKAIVFLNKVDHIVNRKKTGNIMTHEEYERLEKLLKEEKPKGYIEPEILIPQLQKDIIISVNSCKNINDFENFFKSLENKNRRMTENISSNLNNSRSCENIFGDINNINPINMKINKDNNNLILNKRKLSFYRNFINNTNTTGTTDIYATRKSSTKEPSKEYTTSNVSSIVSRRSFHFSPIISPFGRNIFNNNKIQFNENSTNRINSSKIEFQNDFKNTSNTIDIPLMDINTKIRKKTLLNNNLKINNLKRKNKLRHCVSSHFFIRENSAINDIKDNKSDHYEFLDLLNKLDNRNLFDQSPIISEKKRINKNNTKNADIDINSNTHENKIVNFNFDSNDNNDNNNNEDKKQIDIKNNKKIKIKKKNLKTKKSIIFNNPNTTTKKEEEHMKYKKLENLFKNAVNLGFNSTKNKSELEEYINSTGKNINKKPNKKDTYFDIYKIKEKAIKNNNLLLDGFIIRNGTNDKKSLTNEQLKILDKNNYYKNEMINFEMKFKEMLCEETMDK